MFDRSEVWEFLFFDIFLDFQGAAAAFSGENWRQKCQKVEESVKKSLHGPFFLYMSLLYAIMVLFKSFLAFLCVFNPKFARPGASVTLQKPFKKVMKNVKKKKNMESL